MKHRRNPASRLLGGLLLFLSGSCTAAESEAKAEPAGAPVPVEKREGPRASTIAACAACHGASGEGNREKLSPSLAGMPAWYLEKAMAMFIDGRRKVLPDGGHGDEMVRLLKATDPSELQGVAEHYASLEPIKIKSELGGDARIGQSIYRGRGACINCHLFNGKGAQRSGAPPITIIPEWYFVRQMRAFREGERVGSFRGGHGARSVGHGNHRHTEEEILRCMIRAASRLDDEASKDVAAYLARIAGR